MNDVELNERAKRLSERIKVAVDLKQTEQILKEEFFNLGDDQKEEVISYGKKEGYFKNFPHLDVLFR